MPLTLHSIQPSKGSKKSKKRIGRGLASKGRYSGRGVKGQRSSYFGDGAKVSPKILLKKGLVQDISNGVKVLGHGDIKIKLFITDCKVSMSAKEKIEAAGGTVVEQTSK